MTLREREVPMIGRDEASIPATLHGVDVVWMKNADGTGALAYPGHVDESGNIKPQHAFSNSYAHVFPGGVIRRYGDVIGSVDDLKFRAVRGDGECGEKAKD